MARSDLSLAGEYFANGFMGRPMLTEVQRQYFENLAIAAHRVPTPLTVIDVGASDASFTIALSRYYSPRRALCYEPLPDDWPTPDTKHLRFPVEFRRAAVGAAVGAVELHRYSSGGLASVLPLSADYRYVFPHEPLEVVRRELVSLESDLGPRVNELRPMLLKIDAQGNELAILKGADRLLNPESIPIVTLEAMVRRKYVNQATLHDVVAFLATRSYQVFDISRGYREPGTGQYSEYDVTFWHEKYLE